MQRVKQNDNYPVYLFALTAEQLDAFHRDGVLALPSRFSPDGYEAHVLAPGGGTWFIGTSSVWPSTRMLLGKACSAPPSIRMAGSAWR